MDTRNGTGVSSCPIALRRSASSSVPFLRQANRHRNIRRGGTQNHPREHRADRAICAGFPHSAIYRVPRPTGQQSPRSNRHSNRHTHRSHRKDLKSTGFFWRLRTRPGWRVADPIRGTVLKYLPTARWSEGQRFQGRTGSLPTPRCGKAFLPLGKLSPRRVLARPARV